MAWVAIYAETGVDWQGEQLACEVLSTPSQPPLLRGRGEVVGPFDYRREH